jgi:hypothetical protein
MNGEVVSSVIVLLLLVVFVVFGIYIWAQMVVGRPRKEIEWRWKDPPLNSEPLAPLPTPNPPWSQPEPSLPPPASAPPPAAKVKPGTAVGKFLEDTGGTIGLALALALSLGALYGGYKLLVWIVARFLNDVQSAR